MIEPLHPDNHVARVGLPHRRDPANIGTIWSAGRQEHGTISDGNRLLASLDHLVKLFLHPSLHATPPVTLPSPGPKLPSGEEGCNFALVLLGTVVILLLVGLEVELHVRTIV